MKKFQYKLETLLKVLEREEETARQNLSAISQVLHEKTERMKALEKEKKSVEEKMRFQKGAEVCATSLATNCQYMGMLKEKIAYGQRELVQIKNLVEEKREEASKAMRKRKVIENLREKDYEKWKNEAKIQEEAFFDEQMTMHHGR